MLQLMQIMLARQNRKEEIEVGEKTFCPLRLIRIRERTKLVAALEGNVIKGPYQWLVFIKGVASHVFLGQTKTYRRSNQIMLDGI